MTTRAFVSPWAILAAILLGTFVGTLANSVANVALPAVMAEFAVPLSSALWVVTLYILLFAVLMPVCGYLGDLYGQRRMYLLGMTLFSVASLGSGLAFSFPWLLGSRALQGIGVAPTLPAVMAIISRTFSPAQRGRAMGFWALANGAGHALGPPLSGFLIQHLSWRAVFLFSLPLCLLNLGMVWWLVPPDDGHAARSFDFGGAATLTIVALGLMLALTQSVRWGWELPRGFWLWSLPLVALVVFVIVERRVESPFVELGLFTNRPYAAATAVIAAQFFCLFGMQLLLPLFTAALVAPLAGRFADRCGSRLSCFLGMGVVALAGISLISWRATTSPWQIVISLAALGLGMGLNQSPVAAAVTFVVAKEQLGVALGIFSMVRFISGSLGATIFGIILQGASSSPNLGAFRLDFYLLIAVASVAALLALHLPGPIACQPLSDQNE